MPDYYALILYPLGVIFTLAAVGLGGFLVWKTKRDSGDRLFGREPKGDAFNIDEPWEKDFPKPEAIETPAETAAAALRFRKQMEDEEVPTPKIAKELGEEK